MLVLSRKTNGAVLLLKDGDLLARVVIVQAGETVRLGFEANDEVVIAREELLPGSDATDHRDGARKDPPGRDARSSSREAA